ncbi:MAG: hypothetical protein ACOC00_00690 [Halothiobacillaceae bacterium]
MVRDLETMLCRRRRLVRIWPRIAVALVLLTIGLFAALFIFQPLLVNPLEVLAMIEAGTLEPSTQALLAAMAPVLLLAVGALLILLILFVTAGMINERRLLDLIDDKALLRRAPQTER